MKAAEKTPITARGLLFHDTEINSMFVELAAQQRDEAALRQYAPLAEETAVRDGHILNQAVAHRGWGVLHRLGGEYGAAESRLKQALELFEGLETRWQIGRTLYELGELALEQAEPGEAESYYCRALDWFEGIGAGPDAARTRRALESLGNR